MDVHYGATILESHSIIPSTDCSSSSLSTPLGSVDHLRDLLFNPDQTLLKNEILEALDHSGIKDIKNFQLSIRILNDLTYTRCIHQEAPVPHKSNKDRNSSSCEHINAKITGDGEHQMSTDEKDVEHLSIDAIPSVHSFLKEECRSLLKSVVSDVLTSSERGTDGEMSRVLFDPTSPVKVVITLGRLEGDDDSCRTTTKGKRRKYKTKEEDRTSK